MNVHFNNSNPEVLYPGWLVLYIKRYRDGKSKMHVGRVINGLNDGTHSKFKVEDIESGDADYPYSQDVIPLNNGAEIQGITAGIVIKPFK